MNAIMRTTLNSLIIASLCCASAWAAGDSWQPAQGPLKTRWAKDVSPANAHPEYPRPQMVREEWLNLNGLWDLAITAKDATRATFDTQILVPYPGRVGAVGRHAQGQRERPHLVSAHV